MLGEGDQQGVVARDRGEEILGQRRFAEGGLPIDAVERQFVVIEIEKLDRRSRH